MSSAETITTVTGRKLAFVGEYVVVERVPGVYDVFEEDLLSDSVVPGLLYGEAIGTFATFDEGVEYAERRRKEATR